MISNKTKSLFIRIPKCAGSSMQKFFDPYLEVEISKVNSEKFTLTQASSYRAALGTKEWDSLFTFAIVRNPYDRSVSAWQMFEPKQNFRSFLEKLSRKL